MSSLPIDIWSDIACPWCYVGKRKLEAALSEWPHRDAVTVVWHAFELDPSAPRVDDSDVPMTQRLARKYGTTEAQARAFIERMTESGAEVGLELRFDRLQPGNTFDAHRVLHLASKNGLQDTVKERLLRAYLTEGEAIGDRHVLTRLASEAGLDADEVSGLLDSDLYAREVREDEARAGALGIQGVPCFVIGGRYAVSGAQPPDVLRRVLDKAWAEQPAPEAPSDGAACTPADC